MNFASWYSKELPESEKRGNNPIELPAEFLHECSQKMGIESLVNTMYSSSGFFQTYLVEGGVMVTVTQSREDHQKIGIEMASRSSSALIDAAARLDLPLSVGKK